MWPSAQTSHPHLELLVGKGVFAVVQGVLLHFLATRVPLCRLHADLRGNALHVGYFERSIRGVFQRHHHEEHVRARGSRFLLSDTQRL